MAKVVYISADVIQHSMLNTGDAIAAFTSWKPKRGENVFCYEQADIRITAANGAIYLMSKAETKKPKIPFTPVPAAELGKLVRSLNGAA